MTVMFTAQANGSLPGLKLKTGWAEKIDVKHVFPEYPLPIFMESNVGWVSLLKQLKREHVGKMRIFYPK